MFFLSSPNGLSRFVRDPARRFFLGGRSTLQLNFDGSQHQGVQGVRCSQESRTCSGWIASQVGIGKSKKKITTKIHARLRLLDLKKNECSDFSPRLNFIDVDQNTGIKRQHLIALNARPIDSFQGLGCKEA